MTRRTWIAATLLLFGLATALAQPPQRPRDDGPAKPTTPKPSSPPSTSNANEGGEKPVRPSEEAVPGLGPTGPSVKVKTGFIFTEGPAVDRDGNVYFSDVPASQLYKLDVSSGEVRKIRDKTNRGNGLMVNARGEVITCEGDGAVVAFNPENQERKVLAEKYQTKPFNGPNDLVIDRLGGIYFTDPYFGRAANAKQDKQGVYYLSPTGNLARVVEDIPLPNGVVLSPDETRLYVISSAQPRVMMYPVSGPGRLETGRDFCVLQRPRNNQPAAGDGCTVDEAGNLYVASAVGIQVYSPEGKLLGVIRVPESPSNCTFGGKDMKTLYVTARTSLYAFPMNVKGHRFPAGK